jgi:PAS domain S-box-containing protein
VPEPGAHRALIHAPRGRDADVASKLLNSAHIASTICPDIQSFRRALDQPVGFAVVTDEALISVDLRPVAQWVRGQPTWSDLPFIVLTHRGGGLEHRPEAEQVTGLLGNVTFLERPFHPTTFLSVARGALNGRGKQYEARARIEALYEGEIRLRTALLAGRLGTWELDLATLALDTSDGCKALFGRGPDESFSYSDMMAAVHPDDRARGHAGLRATIDTGADYAVEQRVVLPDGQVHWAEMHARVLRDRKGKIRLAGVSSDITERKRTEGALRFVNEMLEERVAQRTAALREAHARVVAESEQRQRAEEQLRQAQKLEIIGQITGGVAHDFNNLLTAVLGNLELLGKHVQRDSREARLIDGAMQGARRGAALTQRLLAFARRQDLRVEAADLAELIRGMSDLLRRSIGSRIELRLELPDALSPVLIDANQLELALLNLSVNARDAMPDGGCLVIGAENAEADGPDLNAGRYVRLRVTDTGAGMDAETLRRATEPFFSTKEFGKGTGLGLSMVQGLAMQLNGTLRLSSQPGRGTTAELWLPAAAAVRERNEAPPVRPVTESAESHATILVVDDDALIAMSTVEMIEDLGHDVIEAGSGQDALDILREPRPVDLLITDYLMPNMTGAELAKAARELRPGLPVLLATGYAELPRDSDIDLPRLGKPYRQEQLALEIARALRKRAA